MGPDSSLPHAPEHFIRPKIDVTRPTSPEEGCILTLPDLVEFNSVYNRYHLFCVQYSHNVGIPPTALSHGDLYDAVLRFSSWLISHRLAQRPEVVNGNVVKARPVGVLMSSDVMWFIAFVSLVRLGVPVLCMSARLSPQAIVHLVRKTDAQAILFSPQLDALVEDSKTHFASAASEETGLSWHQVPSYQDVLDPRSKFDINSVPPPPPYVNYSDRNVVILHSSGTTGLPKPIFHSHAYLLGYATCHNLTAAEVENAMNVSTLPLFHGFGLLAPCLSLSTGLPFSLPASTAIPTGSSTQEILRTSGATSLLTVPSILEELYQLPEDIGTTELRKLRFVAVGGAPMKHTVASALVAAGVRLLNHWGVTEIGAIAPIMTPPPDYDWRFLRVRDDIHLRFEPLAEQPGHVRLTGRPPLIADDFVVQDVLVANPAHPREFRIAGRADDLVVLATGEKVRPALLEQSVAEHPLVRGALAIGAGRAQLALLVEAAPHAALDLADPAAVSAFVDALWPAVEAGNAQTDLHARVARELVLVTDARTRPLARTPKGSIPRGPNVELFGAQIDALYDRADTLQAEPLPLDDLGALRDAVRRLVHGVMRGVVADGDNFFEKGMDSLQATMLRRRLAAAMGASARGGAQEIPPLPMDIVYANSSIAMLCVELRTMWSDGAKGQDRLEILQEVKEEYVKKVLALQSSSTAQDVDVHSTNEKIVLLTGSSGSLGSAMLYELVSSVDVARVYALNRKGTRDLRERQEEGIRKLGLQMSQDGWKKVTLLEVELGDEKFGLSATEYEQLKGASHIIHNAWPMDFNRALTSFRPHLDATKNIIDLALSCTSSQQVHLLFSSSIAVVGRYPLRSPSPPTSAAPIPEEYLDDPAAIDHFGYAEAKWVCEEMFRAAGAHFQDRIVAGVVRIGQMAGAERTGEWNTAEHFPMIVKSSQTLGALPEIPGTASWIPADRAARAMVELLAANGASRVLHLENPARQPWADILAAVAASLPPLSAALPYERWLEAVKATRDPGANPCAKIVPFLEEEFLRMAAGAVVLDTREGMRRSETLQTCGILGLEVVKRYVDTWRQRGFLD
ncbi:hypothetical protein PHLGIDRAFT_106815 [Phlebiopsis gigantea 11061_1 CR5-6]|uniref:Carrier domain-containing protein n=1 Tax=Phlebiopsis gigantea (strain 11061_1 CR5-6) TaxID=745531 RepID=A0A0C3NN89_PHLG1|nr:hypothetical protein PHLGIDRAFT_106815 [Phlebiopsis gigantea 11061_1 CR5-6]